MKNILVILASLALAGCAHDPLRTATSTAAIRGAEEAGAKDVPAAALHVQLAKEAEAEAKELAEQGKRKKAESLLTRATADAELAVVLARAEAARTAADEAQERVGALKSENK